MRLVCDWILKEIALRLDMDCQICKLYLTEIPNDYMKINIEIAWCFKHSSRRKCQTILDLSQIQFTHLKLYI